MRITITINEWTNSAQLEWRVIQPMSEQIKCPECGNRMRKGSTFCMHCGARIPEDVLPESTLEEKMLGETEDILPAVEDSGLDDINESTSAQERPDPDAESPAPSENLSWDEEIPMLSTEAVEETQKSNPAKASDTEEKTDTIAIADDLSWEEGVDGIKEGMPFKEIEPPRVYAEAHDTEVTTEEALEHLFPEVKDDATRDAVAHLFPEGRGSTNLSFIDVVVGKPERISIKKPLREIETPVCLTCGTIPTSDGFAYPSYVFDALGKARIENGEKLLQENEHETAIENFEMAKLLFEKSGNEKNLAEAIKRIDLGYDEMAKSHYDQAETHLKEGEFEWAVVQFKKARELYMFTTDAKKRVKCAERARESYAAWGKLLEDEADQLSKAGETREALAKYQEAAAKYRESGDTKRLRGLDRKIRKA